MANAPLHEFIARNREEIIRRVRQSVTGLAAEMDAPISTDDFQTLNRCLEYAIAGAIAEYGRERNQSMLDGESARGSERLGFLAHEVRNLTNTAILAFELLQTGTWESGATGPCSIARPHGDTALSQAGHSPRPISLSAFRIGSSSGLKPSSRLEPAHAQRWRRRPRASAPRTMMPVEDGVVI